MEKQYQHILTLLKEKEAIMQRDKAVTERECRTPTLGARRCASACCISYFSVS